MAPEIFRTTDFYSAVVLRSFNFHLLVLTKVDQTTIAFVFEEKAQQCEDLLKKFWDRKLSVEPRVFIENINELKIRIHQFKN